MFSGVFLYMLSWCRILLNSLPGIEEEYLKEGFGGNVGPNDCLECQQCHKGEASAVTSVRLEQKARPRNNFWLHLLTPLSPAAPGSGNLCRYCLPAAHCPGRGIS